MSREREAKRARAGKAEERSDGVSRSEAIIFSRSEVMVFRGAKR